MSKKIIKAELDFDEADLLFGMLHKEIVDNKILTRLSLLAGEITQERFDWHQAHALYLEGIYEKLTGQKWKL